MKREEIEKRFQLVVQSDQVAHEIMALEHYKTIEIVIATELGQIRIGDIDDPQTNDHEHGEFFTKRGKQLSDAIAKMVAESFQDHLDILIEKYTSDDRMDTEE